MLQAIGGRNRATSGRGPGIRYRGAAGRPNATRIDRQWIARKEPRVKVLVLCSGNICRSPMAAVLLRAVAAKQGLDDLTVLSAGLLGIEDQPAAPSAVAVLREVGVDLSGHRSRGVRAADFDASDLVLVMDRWHVEEITRCYPTATATIRLLRSFEHGAEPREEAPDLDDPIGKPIEAFRSTLAIVVPCVKHVAEHLKGRDGASRGKTPTVHKRASDS